MTIGLFGPSLQLSRGGQCSPNTVIARQICHFWKYAAGPAAHPQTSHTPCRYPHFAALAPIFIFFGSAIEDDQITKPRVRFSK